MPLDARPRKRGAPYPFEPFTMTWGEVSAAVFRASEVWVRGHLPTDFPRPDPVLDVFATEAVQAWVRRRFGLVTTGADPADEEAILIQRARNGKPSRQISGRSAT
jgi:hypothetical protein